ncbi:MAG: very short patch repair endonuclease [Phycisphaeraceae bacterium]|nr:very short patch repair endonuclease [Phycisphaeraceae bacterium]
MDRFSPEERSRIMRTVRWKNTKPEVSVRRMLHGMGFRFRLHRRDLPGRPDIVLPRYRTVIFVNGCFWHQHSGCRKATIPQNNRAFWEKKLMRTIERDAENRQKLTDCGWTVITVWECEIKKSMKETMRKIVKKLQLSAQNSRIRIQK